MFVEIPLVGLVERMINTVKRLESEILGGLTQTMMWKRQWIHCNKSESKSLRLNRRSSSCINFKNTSVYSLVSYE